MPGQSAAAALSPKDYRQNGVAGFLAHEQQIGETVGVDIAHPSGRRADIVGDNDVGYFADAGYGIQFNRSQQHVAFLGAMHQQIALAVAVEIGQADAAAQTFLAILAYQGERIPQYRRFLGGDIDARNGECIEAGRLGVARSKRNNSGVTVAGGAATVSRSDIRRSAPG